MEHLEKKSERLNSWGTMQPSELQSQESGLFQFQDKRPQSAAHQKLQRLSATSSQVNSIHAIQLMANNGASTPISNSNDAQGELVMRTSQNIEAAPIQRAVITVNADKLIGESAQTVADKTGATAGAFSEVEVDETIYIFAHGYHSLTKLPTDDDPKTNLEPELMGGITAAKLVHMMIEEGWHKKHKGPIDLRACMSGAESMLPSFAELFATELKKVGRSNKVTGYKELTKTEGDGTEVSMKPTVSKMILVAQTFDPSDLGDQIFAIQVVTMFEEKNGKLKGLRAAADGMAKFKTMPALLVGNPPDEMSPLEWNVYSYYHALATGNEALIIALKGDFKARSYQINKVDNAPHGRQFDPADMVVPEEVVPEELGSDDDGGIDEDLLARLSKLKSH